MQRSTFLTCLGTFASPFAVPFAVLRLLRSIQTKTLARRPLFYSPQLKDALASDPGQWFNSKV